jgi:hypothetical protein
MSNHIYNLYLKNIIKDKCFMSTLSENIFPDINTINCFNLYGIREHDVLLPNLRFKNNKIYYYSINPLRITKNGKKEYLNEILLDNLVLETTVYYLDIEIRCKILEIEDKNGLIMNLKFRDRHDISNRDVQDFARYIEAKILKINSYEPIYTEYTDESNTDDLDNDDDEDCDDEDDVNKESLYEDEDLFIDNQEFNTMKKFDII